MNRHAPMVDGRALTANEAAWVDFLRLISEDRDPPVTLRAVQALRRALAPQDTGAGMRGAEPQASRAPHCPCERRG